jgi:hypothetical protein
MANLPSDVAAERISEAGLLALAAATQCAVFSAPLALIGAAIGEWQRIGSWIYYVAFGVVIAAIGFLAQYWSEAGGENSIVNPYALSAFLVTGLVAGLIYWLASGRFAVSPWPDEEPPLPEITRQPRPEPKPATGPGGTVVRTMPRT